MASNQTQCEVTPLVLWISFLAVTLECVSFTLTQLSIIMSEYAPNKEVITIHHVVLITCRYQSMTMHMLIYRPVLLISRIYRVKGGAISLLDYRVHSHTHTHTHTHTPHTNTQHIYIYIYIK